MTNWLPLLSEIADLAEPIAMKYFTATDLQIDIKSNMTPVSQGDLEIETAIRNLIKDKNLNLTVIGEEHGKTEGNPKQKLIIDPIDGTKNFIRGLPFFATLLAIEENGEVVAGLISAPATGDRWHAEKGNGAHHNGKKIQVSTIDKLETSLALHGSIFGSEASDNPEKVLSLLKKTYRQRGFGDYYPHMLVAQGLGEFAIDFKLQVWDIAAIKIIIEEAGGKMTDTSGNPSIHSGNLISSNGKLHDLVLEEIKDLN